MCNFILVTVSIHIVITIAQYACDPVLNKGFKAVNVSIANISTLQFYRKTPP